MAISVATPAPTNSQPSYFPSHALIFSHGVYFVKPSESVRISSSTVHYSSSVGELSTNYRHHRHSIQYHQNRRLFQASLLTIPLKNPCRRIAPQDR